MFILFYSLLVQVMFENCQIRAQQNVQDWQMNFTNEMVSTRSKYLLKFF